jgi:hypothetical protein
VRIAPNWRRFVHAFCLCTVPIELQGPLRGCRACFGTHWASMLRRRSLGQKNLTASGRWGSLPGDTKDVMGVGFLAIGCRVRFVCPLPCSRAPPNVPERCAGCRRLMSKRDSRHCHLHRFFCCRDPASGATTLKATSCSRAQSIDRVESSCEVSADVGCPPLGFSRR